MPINMSIEYPKLERKVQELKYQLTQAQRAVEAMEKYKQFFVSCSCYFSEGVEFMSKEEIYEAIKREVKQLECEETK